MYEIDEGKIEDYNIDELERQARMRTCMDAQTHVHTHADAKDGRNGCATRRIHWPDGGDFIDNAVCVP